MLQKIGPYALCVFIGFGLAYFFKSFDLVDARDFARDNGSQYSIKAFGYDWENVTVAEAISLWNKKHPEAEIKNGESVKGALRKIANTLEDGR